MGIRETELRQEIERLEKRLELAESRLAGMAGFVRPGMAVWYESRPGVKHAATVAGDPRELGNGQICVALRDLDEAYVKENDRSTVKAAATWCLTPRDTIAVVGDGVVAARRVTGETHDEPIVATWQRRAHALLDEIAKAGGDPLDLDNPKPPITVALFMQLQRFVHDVALGYGRMRADMDAVHEAHRVLIGRRATELLERMNEHGAKGIRAAVDDIGELGRDVYRLVEDLAHPPETRDVCVIEELTDVARKDTADNWYKRRPKTVTELAEFVDELVLGYRHTYGSIVDAVAAAAMAAARTVNASPQGGVTGAQASIVPFIFIREWLNKGDRPLGLRDFSNMLYPQYADDFRTIRLETFQWLQQRARELLAEYDGVKDQAPVGEVEKHWRSIVDGKVPFGYRVKD